MALCQLQTTAVLMTGKDNKQRLAIWYIIYVYALSGEPAALHPTVGQLHYYSHHPVDVWSLPSLWSTHFSTHNNTAPMNVIYWMGGLVSLASPLFNFGAPPRRRRRPAARYYDPNCDICYYYEYYDTRCGICRRQGHRVSTRRRRRRRRYDYW